MTIVPLSFYSDTNQWLPGGNLSQDQADDFYIHRHELAAVEDWRGTGGDSSDTGTLQNACNAGVMLRLPALLTIEAGINVTKGGTSLIGLGWGVDTAVASQPGTGASGSQIIWAGGTPVAGTAMLWVKSATALSYLWDFNINRVYLLGGNLAPVGLRLSSTRTAHIGRLYVERCSENHVLLDDGNGVLHYSTRIDELYMTSGSSSGTLNANGLNIRATPTGGGVGCTWPHGTFVQADMQAGDGVIFGNVDNCHFAKIASGSSTGKGIRFRGLSDGQAQVSRKNFVSQFSGSDIYAEAKSRNAVDWVNSEGTSVTIEPGGALHYKVIDRKDGRRWGGFVYDVNTELILPLNHGYLINGTPALTQIGATKGAGIAFDGAVLEGWAWTVPPQRTNSGGQITGLKITGLKSTGTNAGDIRIEISAIGKGDTSSFGGAMGVQAYTHAVDAAGTSTIEEFQLNFTTPMEYPVGYHFLLWFRRLAADVLDTYPDDWVLLSVTALSKADVGDSDSNGLYRYQPSPDRGDVT